MTESEQIDEILVIVIGGEYIGISASTPDLYRSAVRKMEAYGLVARRGNTYDITARGHAAHNAGGFDKWGPNNERRENEAHQATLDSAKAIVDAAKSAKWSKYAAIVSAIAAILAFVLPPLLTTKAESGANARLNALSAKVDTLYLQSKLLSQSQTTKAASQKSKK